LEEETNNAKADEKKKHTEDSEHSEDESDEIGIDFGKVKNFFKKAASSIDDDEDSEKEPVKKEAKQEHKEEKEEHKPKPEPVQKEMPEDTDEGDDVSLDFSKIKTSITSLFKPKKSHKQESAETEEDADEISIDFKKMAPFLKKYSVLLLILIPLLFSVCFRVQPAILPMTDNWARDTMYNNIRNQISNQINQQYPNLPDVNRNALVEEEFQKVLTEQKAALKEQINQISQGFKSRLQDESGQTYLLAIDPYFWLRHVNNVLENGHPGDRIVDGRSYNDYMYAPVGRYEISDMFHAYFSAYLYKIVSFFNPSLPVKNFFFFVPVLIASLSVIPAFFIARKVGGNLGGLFAGILMAVHSGFLTRTAAGFADTDAYNVFFPLWIMWLFLEAFETKNIKIRIGLVVVAGFLTGLYSTAWGGWWYILDFVLAAGGLFILYNIITGFRKLKKGQGLLALLNQRATKNALIILIVYFIITSIIAIFFVGFGGYTEFIEGPGKFATLQDIGVSGNWPNVFTTVAEQNVSSFKGVIGSIGGKFLYTISIIGLLFTLLRKNIYGKRDILYAIILIIWLVAATYASVKGVRYILLLVPVFSIGFGIFAGVIYQYVSKWVVKELHIDKYLASAVLIIVLGLLLVGPVRGGWNTAQVEMPSMNDAWYNTLTKIDTEAESDAIINSWWDFGHWFKMVGNRAVTFDGTSQNTPMAHWVGLSLLTNNEDFSVGILRMLDCGSREGYWELNKHIPEDYQAVELMYDIVVEEDWGDAKEILNDNGLTDEQAEAVLQYTHCDAPQNYYITSHDMIGKSGVWAHFGSWNFTRATQFNQIKGMKLNQQQAIDYLSQEFNYSQSAAQSRYFEIAGLGFGRDANDWIAPWPGYAGGPQGCSWQSEILLNCGGLEIDITDKFNPDIVMPESQGQAKPHSIVYATVDGLKEKVYSEGTGPYSVALVPDDKNYFIVLMQPNLARSMFTTLFYYEGHGLNHFQKFDDQRQLTGGRILVWNVSWEGMEEPNIMPEVAPRTEVKEGFDIVLNYIGWVIEDGEAMVFDSSISGWQALNISSETEFEENFTYNPLGFTAAAGQVVPGFDNAVIGMNKGAEKTFEIPPEEAYGTDPTTHPLGNKTLNFKVKVVDIS